ncbi:putative ammonium transporter 1 isoform X1 [Ptychodera flava]|uniref:putative ammonium transporter 1 isoform X1 n=1 Tax=Ptychodera flava TaxID=63121 RepID=UPI003969C5A4
MTGENLEDSFGALGENQDSFLTLVSCLALFIQCGFALLEAGLVQSKNTTNILTRHLVCISICASVYFACGYAFAFGPGNIFVGYDYFFMKNLPDRQFSHWLSQFVYVVTTTTIVAGAVAGRVQFTGYIVYSVSIAGVVQPIATHWAWTYQGWLVSKAPGDELKYQDFAGGGVVHVVGGAVGLIGTAVVGPRLGRFQSVNKPQVITKPERSTQRTSIGGVIIMLGMFALNCGGKLNAPQVHDGSDDIPLVFINTLLSGCFASMTALTLKKSQLGRMHATSSLIVTINGALTGMVSISAGCNSMQPWCAILTGLVSGITYFAWSKFIDAIKVDDPVDAIAVHLGGGFWGLCAVSLFTKGNGVVFTFSSNAWRSFGWNITGGFVMMVWSMVLSLAIFGSLHLCKRLRITLNCELTGLNINREEVPVYIGSNFGVEWGRHLADHHELELVSVNYNTDHLKVGDDSESSSTKDQTHPEENTTCMTIGNLHKMNGLTNTVTNS